MKFAFPELFFPFPAHKQASVDAGVLQHDILMFRVDGQIAFDMPYPEIPLERKPKKRKKSLPQIMQLIYRPMDRDIEK